MYARAELLHRLQEILHLDASVNLKVPKIEKTTQNYNILLDVALKNVEKAYRCYGKEPWNS